MNDTLAPESDEAAELQRAADELFDLDFEPAPSDSDGDGDATKLVERVRDARERAASGRPSAMTLIHDDMQRARAEVESLARLIEATEDELQSAHVRTDRPLVIALERRLLELNTKFDAAIGNRERAEIAAHIAAVQSRPRRSHRRPPRCASAARRRRSVRRARTRRRRRVRRCARSTADPESSRGDLDALLAACTKGGAA